MSFLYALATKTPCASVGRMKQEILHFTLESPEYPAVFRQLTDPPKEFFVRGNIDLIQSSDRPVVGIVGTRRADSSARRLARETAQLLAQTGCTVISGLAFGVDAEAHQGTLQGNGKTVAVLGNGLDESVMSPTQHRALAKKIVEQGGALLSEYPPTYPAGKYTYPARNRLIAALCTHLVVIQAPVGSGALITVDHALSLGRSIATFPGPTLNPGWLGSNKLLKDGAEVLCEPLDALHWLGIDVQASLPLASGQGKVVLEALKTETNTTQELIQKTALPAAELLKELSLLELSGQIELISGKWILAGRKI